MTTLGLQWLQHQETIRSNKAKEQNTVYQIDTQKLTADADRQSKESIASLDRYSKESIASKDRTSRENIASLDRQSNEMINANKLAHDELINTQKLQHDAQQQYQTRENQLQMNTDSNQSKEFIAYQDRLSRENIATLDRASREMLNQLDNSVKFAIAEIQDNRNAESNALKIQSELIKAGAKMASSSEYSAQMAGLDLLNSIDDIDVTTGEGLGEFMWWLKNVYGSWSKSATGLLK